MALQAKDRSAAVDITGSSGSRERVDGWKEIAAYLGRAERTVKRWEADRKLPVHRVPGGGRGSVHAYQRELDLWLTSERHTEPPFAEAVEFVAPEADERCDEVEVNSRPLSVKNLEVHRWTLAGVALVAAAALSLGTLWLAGHARAASSTRVVKTESRVSPAERAAARSLYLNGRFEWNKRTPESLNRALDAFTQSIVHDPTAAPAYAGLADTYVLLCEYSMVQPQEAYPRAIAAATKAVELDDSLAEAHRSLGFAEIWGKWDFRDGERELRRAIALNPRDPLAHLWFATAFSTPEWYRITSHEFDLAQELDPSSTTTLVNKSIWLFNVGHREEGLELAHQMERAEPSFVAPHRYLAYMYWDQREYREFLTESKMAADLQRNQTESKIMVAALKAFRDGGAQQMLQSLYRSRKRQDENIRVNDAIFPMICLRLGRKDEAFQRLNDDFANHRATLQLLTEPSLREVSEDPRYHRLLQKLNFPNPPTSTFD